VSQPPPSCGYEVDAQVVDRNGHGVEFVGSGCEGLGMEEIPKEHSRETTEVLTSQARWAVDYIGSANNQILLRSATLIGFLAIEFSFIAAWNPSDFDRICNSRWYFGLGLLTIFCSVVSFIWAGKTKGFKYLNFDQIRYAQGRDSDEAGRIPLAALLKKNDGQDLFDRLKMENDHIGRYFNLGVGFLLAAQFLLGLLIFQRWVN
jgi:hypothetical protein